uniref:Uncharacterized protein n=1 Tax=Plectus sambesii TaxID=2011161 RepID=A0A914VWI1_9BILA
MRRGHDVVLTAGDVMRGLPNVTCDGLSVETWVHTRYANTDILEVEKIFRRQKVEGVTRVSSVNTAVETTHRTSGIIEPPGVSVELALKVDFSFRDFRPCVGLSTYAEEHRQEGQSSAFDSCQLAVLAQWSGRKKRCLPLRKHTLPSKVHSRRALDASGRARFGLLFEASPVTRLALSPLPPLALFSATGAAPTVHTKRDVGLKAISPPLARTHAARQRRIESPAPGDDERRRERRERDGARIKAARQSVTARIQFGPLPPPGRTASRREFTSTQHDRVFLGSARTSADRSVGQIGAT